MKATDQTFALNDLTDDMTARQLTLFINWLWINQYKMTRGNLRSFKKQNGMAVD